MKWKIGETIVFHMVHGGLFEVSVRGYFQKLDGSIWVVGQDLVNGLVHMRDTASFQTEGKRGHELSKYIA